jgi:FkbM family methyltransferase
MALWSSKLVGASGIGARFAPRSTVGMSRLRRPRPRSAGGTNSTHGAHPPGLGRGTPRRDATRAVPTRKHVKLFPFRPGFADVRLASTRGSMQIARCMQSFLAREIVRRNPFRLEELPWIAKVYRYPFDRWTSLGRQALYGAPCFMAFLLYQKFWPCPAKGKFIANVKGQEKAIWFDVRNTQFHALYFSAFVAGYEPHLTALMDLLAGTNGVFYDIGSNWGWFSLMIASRSDFKGEIHAFEPFPSTYADLSNVIKQAGVEDTVLCHNVALTDRTGETFMHFPDHFQSGMASVEEEASSGSKVVKTATLDSLQIDPPTVMKVDVEGVESKVFRGGSAMLAKHRPMILFENNRASVPAHTLEPLFFLRDIGYLFFNVTWLREDQGRTFFIEDDGNPAPGAKETLALVPFEPRERFLFPGGINMFACHKDKLGELKTLFTERQA